MITTIQTGTESVRRSLVEVSDVRRTTRPLEGAAALLDAWPAGLASAETYPNSTLLYLPYPTLPYPTLPYPTVPYRTLPYPTVPYLTAPCPTLPYRTLPYCTVPRTVPYPVLPNPNPDLTQHATIRRKCSGGKTELRRRTRRRRIIAMSSYYLS